jgi:mono/diheme cytochrome c family protein
MFRSLLVVALAMCLSGCASNGCGSTTSSTKSKSDGNPADNKTPTGSGGDLQGNDQARWHHLSEGSELYPVTWLLALQNADGKPFLDNAERFGLIPDPTKSAQNPFGLPIGLTADYSLDTRFTGLQMVGVNCAACHVNKLEFQGKSVLLDGAPSLFDVESFYTEIVNATIATASNAIDAWNFLGRVYDLQTNRFPDLVPDRLAADVHSVMAAAGGQDLPTLEKLGPVEMEFSQRIKALVDQQKAKKPIDLGSGLKVASSQPDLKQQLQAFQMPGPLKKIGLSPELKKMTGKLLTDSLGKIDLGDTKALAIKDTLETGVFAKVPQAQRELALVDSLTHIGETLGLLWARVEQIKGLLSSKVPSTQAGFGRVDAFGSARNGIFPAQALPKTAPVSYPHLFNLTQLDWFHWDNNTTSLLERNVGQALGLGAVFNPDDFVSTVRVNNIVELEGLARRIKAPKWPADVFPAINEASASEGKKVYSQRCMACHPILSVTDKVADLLDDPQKLLTDPMRANNFAIKFTDGTDYFAQLKIVLEKITAQAGGAVDTKAVWRAPAKYAKRPLVAPWATAPYLHNNSVPNLDALLRPAKDRPTTFPVGQREYDPQKLGFRIDGPAPPGSIPFDTTSPIANPTGNSNAGHDGPLYGTDITEEQRRNLLEYLKTL